MAMAAFLGLLFSVLLFGKGWVGDLLGQVVIGLAFGAAVSEGLRRSLCLLMHGWPKRIPVAVTPLLLFGVHVYALTYVDNLYLSVLAVSSLFGLFVWTLIVIEDYCASLVESMNDFTAKISHHGG